MNKSHNHFNRGFALLALILYIGALIMLCVSAFSAHVTTRAYLASGLNSLHALSDMARMCAEDMAARIYHRPSIQSGFSIKLFGHDCILHERIDLPNGDKKIVVRQSYIDHTLYAWIITDQSGLIILREKI